MEKSTLIPSSSLLRLMKDIKASISIFLKTEKLHYVALFFGFWSIVFALITNLISYIYRQDDTGLVGQIVGMPFYSRFVYMVRLFDLEGMVNFLSPAGLLSMAGLVVAILVFFKRIKVVFGHNAFFRKALTVFVVVETISLLVFLAALSFSQNNSLVIFAILTAMFCFEFLFIVFFTLFEGIFISLAGMVFRGEKAEYLGLFSYPARFLKPLFFFNVLLYITAPSFLSKVMVAPSVLHVAWFGERGSDTTVGFMAFYFYDFLIALFRYGNAILILACLFFPFILVLRPEQDWKRSFLDSLMVIRRDIFYYFWLIIVVILSAGLILSLSAGFRGQSPFSALFVIGQVVHIGLSTFLSMIISLVLCRCVIGHLATTASEKEKASFVSAPV